MISIGLDLNWLRLQKLREGTFMDVASYALPFYSDTKCDCEEVVVRGKTYDPWKPTDASCLRSGRKGEPSEGCCLQHGHRERTSRSKLLPKPVNIIQPERFIQVGGQDNQRRAGLGENRRTGATDVTGLPVLSPIQTGEMMMMMMSPELGSSSVLCGASVWNSEQELQ